MTEDAPILLDVSRLIWRRWKGRLPTGIDRVCLAYLRHFAPRAQAVVQYDGFRRILDKKASRQLFALLDEGANFRPALILAIVRNLGGLNARGDGRLYLNVGHTGLDSPRFGEWVRKAGVKPIYLVHDVIPITHPEYCRAGEAEKHRRRMRTVLSTAAGVIGNSQATLDELADFARAEDLPFPPSLAAWLGVDPLPSSHRLEEPDRPTFIAIGTIEARKNHMQLLDIWSRLIDRFGDGAPRLLIIGQRGWEARQVFNRLDHDEKLRGHVIELGNCTDSELAAHISSARALLFPSHAEGYGLPLIEALSLGVPVIASDLPVFREIAGDIPAYLGPFDSEGWERAISDYCENSADRNRQIRCMKSFRAPDWNSHFALVERWLQSFDGKAQPDQH